MQTILNRRSSQSDARTQTRLPVTFHVPVASESDGNGSRFTPRFTPPIHEAVLHPTLSRRSKTQTDLSRRSAAKTDRTQNVLTLSNTDGFWELTLGNHHAVLIQDQALFYVAFLLAHPGQSFLPLDLAEKVYELYGAHPDFRQNLAALDSRLVQARHAEVLRQKVTNLEAVLDRGDATEPVKAEVLRELTTLYNLQDAAQNEIAESTESTGHVILSSLYRLYLSIADGPALKTEHADPQNPVRPFARYLLRHVLIPSIRLSRDGALRFILEP